MLLKHIPVHNFKLYYISAIQFQWRTYNAQLDKNKTFVPSKGLNAVQPVPFQKMEQNGFKDSIH